ncbi:hypothetical protein [Sporisorium scitamineum]|uniref:Uncharacterized protein n=1 Tax=Sporisorium scitamineum TaxID=49012 RepID=A0A0F7S7B9_9BASI|nr:hypothetical protein [Sporisorium scitamineum]
MSDTEATSSATIPSGGTPTDRPLTNKEKRQLAVAQKRQAKEQAALRKAGKSTTDDATLTPQKRQHDEHKPDSTAISDGEAGEKEEEEVEVVSHKEQRRRKKQAKLDAATAADDDSPTDPNALMHPTRAATNNNTAALPRSGFSIWVGNLSFFTPPAKLVDWFNQRGIDGISRVNMPKGLPAGWEEAVDQEWE